MQQLKILLVHKIQIYIQAFLEKDSGKRFHLILILYVQIYLKQSSKFNILQSNFSSSSFVSPFYFYILIENILEFCFLVWPFATPFNKNLSINDKDYNMKSYNSITVYLPRMPRQFAKIKSVFFLFSQDVKNLAITSF